MRFGKSTRSLFFVPFSFLLACQSGSRVQPTSEQPISEHPISEHPAWVTSAHEQPGRGAGQAVSNLSTYPGLEVTLFASEPMLVNPINLDVDERGRIWVVEVLNYREHGKQDNRLEGDRILILEDVDGDGAADTSKVYYQGRDIDAALGIVNPFISEGYGFFLEPESHSDSDLLHNPG